MEGTVTKFFDEKGFGFIKPDGGGPDVFVHHSVIRMDGFRTLMKGDRVSFEVETGKNGRPCAVNVERYEAAG